MRPGAAARAAAVYPGCRGGTGGRPILHRARKKELRAFSPSRSSSSPIAASPKERAVLLRHRLRCGLRRAGGNGAVQQRALPGVWCGPSTAAGWGHAGAGKQGGCAAGGLPPARRLKGAAVGVRSGRSQVLPLGPRPGLCAVLPFAVQMDWVFGASVAVAAVTHDGDALCGDST